MDKFLNTAAIVGGPKPKLTDDQIAIVDALKEALAQALEGGVYGMAIALAMDGGWATHIAGNRPGDLNLACDDLKGKILQAVLNAPKTKAMARIIRGRMG